MKGAERERHCFAKLEEKGQECGVPFENTLCESIMNACLPRIARTKKKVPIGEDRDTGLVHVLKVTAATSMMRR